MQMNRDYFLRDERAHLSASTGKRMISGVADNTKTWGGCLHVIKL